MKRSEMLEQISWLILNGAYYSEKGFDLLTQEEKSNAQANAILQRIEEKGMLPPLNKKTEAELNKAIQESEHINGTLYDADNVLSYLQWEDVK